MLPAALTIRREGETVIGAPTELPRALDFIFVFEHQVFLQRSLGSMKMNHFFTLLSSSAFLAGFRLTCRTRSAYLLALGTVATTVAQPLAVTTIAGQAGARGSIDAPGTAARFFGPSGLVADGAGGFYVADSLNNTVRRVTSSGVVTTIAGGDINEITSLPSRGYADGTGRDALFATGFAVTSGANGPLIVANYGALTMALDAQGNLYLADTLNHVIRKISGAGVVTTLAGRPGTSGSVNGLGGDAQFSSPYGVAVDRAGNVYVADAGNNTIRKITGGGSVSTHAGRDGSNAGNVDGNGADARFNSPSGVVTDRAGNVYVSDTNNHTIRKISSGGAVTTLAGAAGVKGSSDGIGLKARFNGPTGIAIDSAGSIFVADTVNGTIRRITAAGIVSTVAGLAGSSGAVEGTGNAVRFTTPYSVAVDSDGNILVADSGNNTIRKGVVSSVGTPTIQTQPKTQFVNLTNPVVFTVEATSTTAPTYQWRKNNVNLVGATAATYTIAAAQNADEASYTVVVTSGPVSVTSSAAVLQVYPTSVFIPPIIFIAQPLEQSIGVGESATLVVEVAGSATASFQWQKNEVNIAGATSGTYSITSATGSDTGTYRVVVSAGGDIQNSLSASLTVTGVITPPPPPPLPIAFGRIINLSILTSLAAGGDNFTMGYVVGGNGTSGLKPLVIRAAGPSLGALGVGGTLEDPKLELFAGSTKTTANDDWGGSPQLTAALAAVGAFAYVSPASKDAATSASITTRDNSVVVSAANSGAGLVIAEIYDATASSSFVAATPRLINVSVRKHLGTGLTVGFVLGGAVATKVLIRAVGPTLGGFGVAGIVADPQLTLFNDKSVKIGENNDWGGTAELTAAFGAVGAFALSATAKDAALLVTLPSGNYSVQASGTAGTTGVALVEVYEVP